MLHKYMDGNGSIQPERISILSKITTSTSGSYVLYWMQQAQRTHFNHALEYAIQKANALKIPLVVYFGLTPNYPDTTSRHYQFMLEGLREVSDELKHRNICFICRIEEPFKGIVKVAEEARMVIVDRGCTRIQRQWRQNVAKEIDCPFIEIETEVIVPVKTTSSKEEYGAYTIRPKIKHHLKNFLISLDEHIVKHSSLSLDFTKESFEDISQLFKKMRIKKYITKNQIFIGGYTQARQLLDTFLTKNIKQYDCFRNDPSKQVTSQLSPYLHFGQISSLDIALQVIKQQKRDVHPFLEELIIRRELSMNFVFYNTYYDSINCLPPWAMTTLQNHTLDNKEYLYTLSELTNADTHDPFWNAAQKEMALTGKMHGYMRMYWGKKIIEWTETPQQAYDFALKLNNTYELDGRDPNGFAGVAWCFGKHDRAWKERPIFGKIRYMNSKGLKRKGDMDRYINRINRLEEHI